ncbi:hypothetical protein DSECCO2_237530 [anaerobic digester metagenome]
MPTITDWIMVIITGVYVFATILICVFNYRVTKATREQVAEAKRQFEEINRAYITYEFLFEKRIFYGIRFTNHGKRVANHVQIQFKEEFIASIEEESFSTQLNKQKGKEFVLGIGQSFDTYFGSNEYRQNSNNLPIEGQLVYEDDKKLYYEPFFIDVEHYATIFSVNSETEDLLDKIKAQTVELKGIKQELRQIALSNSNNHCYDSNSSNCIEVQGNE